MRRHDFRSLLQGKLDPEELGLYKSYDIVGDIAVIRVPKKLEQYCAIIAEAIMQLHSNVKSVWRQASPVGGDYRLRRLEHVAGERRTTTTYKEYGCVFKVDLEKCYFSPRLSFERMRVASLVKPREVVVNMFAGVGSFSIIIAKHSEADRIYSIDVNPAAFQFMWENVLLNKTVNRVVPLKGDARVVVTARLLKTADRVLMPLPEKAYDYLDVAVEALKPEGGWIHYYDFVHAKKDESSVEKAKAKVSEKLSQMDAVYAIPFGRVVRDTGPWWQQIVLDVQIRRGRR
ncbi:MAG: class I SAM-dependent methyltransferase family protein [Candidatus Bathyarchaeia archaeon]